jgi:hypothetical protein
MQQQNPINLINLFQSVTGTLAKNKQSLNNADTDNHDHGDNMVDTFEVITQAMREKQGADPADQLAYASQILRQRKSGSAQVYAQGLSQASQQFVGQQVTPNNAMTLITSLLGGGQAPLAPPQDSMGGLLGNLLGGGAQQQSNQQGGMGDLLGSLLGGAGAQQQPTNPPQGQQGSGFDIGTLLNAGMTYMNTKSQGGSDLQAIVNAVISGSAMNSSAHRSQSGSLVANTLLQTISGLARNK